MPIVVVILLILTAISIVGFIASAVNTNPNPPPPTSDYTQLVQTPVPLTIVTSGDAANHPLIFTSTNPDLVFTSPGIQNVTGVDVGGGKYDYIFSTNDTTYVEKDNIPVEFEVVSFNITPDTAVKSISGGIYREASTLTDFAGMFQSNLNIELYDPGLNFGGTHVTDMIEMFAGSSIQTFRLQYGAQFGAVATRLVAMFDSAASLKEFIIPKYSPFGAVATSAEIMFYSNIMLTEINIPRGAQFGASLGAPIGIFSNLEALKTITFDVDSPFGQSFSEIQSFFENLSNINSLKTITFNSAFGRDLPSNGTPTLLNITASNPLDVTFVTPFVLGPQWENLIANIVAPNPNVIILSLGNPITVHPQSVQDAIAANPKVTYSSG